MPGKIATELNKILQNSNPTVLSLLSTLGQDLYFPKGILTQSAEAKEKGKRHNATIGIAKEKGGVMRLPSYMANFTGISAEELFPYAPSPGLPGLRKKWKELMLAKNPSMQGVTTSLPVVTSGITHGLSVAADLFLNSGDTLLLPDQMWGNYCLIFGVRRGANVQKYPFFTADGQFDCVGFKAAVDAVPLERKLTVLLNFPNNPTGYTVTEAEADAIHDVLQARAAASAAGVVALCDDAYFGLRFSEDAMRESIFVRLATAHERLLAVKLDGATKEDYVWGWRVGFVSYGVKGGTAQMYEALEKKTGGCIRGMISNCSMPAQSMVLKAMNGPNYNAERQEKCAVLAKRAACMKAVLADPKLAAVWTAYPFNSGYFMCIKLKGINAELFRLHLLDKYGIGVIATAPTDVRIAFSCVDDEEIPDLVEQMFRCGQEMLANPELLAGDVPADTFEE